MRHSDPPPTACAVGRAVLRTLVEHAPADLLPALRAARVLAGSERLAEEASALGFREVRVATGARPGELLAARDGRSRRGIR